MMQFPGKDWREASPESQGVDLERLGAALQHIRDHTGRDGTDEMLLVRNGLLIWQGPRIGEMHGIWSATKSFTSTVLGLLIDDGRCTLETRAADVIPSLDEVYPDVTLRHFTTMTSGYRAVGDIATGPYIHGPSGTPFDPSPEPLFRPPGSKFAYWDSAMNQFGQVLTHIAGERLKELFKRRIADPIGMRMPCWDWGDFGPVDGAIVNCGSGNGNRYVRITARELARLGHLFLNRGRWNGRQVITEQWVRQAASVQVDAGLPLGQPESGIDGRGVYGFNWWVNGVRPDGRRLWPSAPAGTFLARGYNNNRCQVVPEWRMVIVRLGLDGSVNEDVWEGFFALLAPGIATSTENRRV